MSIGIIGIGRLGIALVRGFIGGGIQPKEIHVYDISSEAMKRAEVLGVRLCRSIGDVIDSSDISIIAVKPKDVENVLKEVATHISEEKALVSVAAFVPLKAIERHIDKGEVYRAMPNIAVEVNKGFIALTPVQRKKDNIEKLFSVIGEVVWVDEATLDLLTIISASTPAIVAEFIDSFMLAALKIGVPYDIAKKAIAAVFQGVGKLFEVKDVNLIRDSVITPRGSTIILIEKLYTYEVKSRLVKALIDSAEEYLEILKGFAKGFEQQ